MLLYQSSEFYKLQLCLTRRRNCVQVVVFVWFFERDFSEISRGGGGVKTEGRSQLFETAEKGGVMKNGPLKGGGSCKYVSVIM